MRALRFLSKSFYFFFNQIAHYTQSKENRNLSSKIPQIISKAIFRSFQKRNIIKKMCIFADDKENDYSNNQLFYSMINLFMYLFSSFITIGMIVYFLTAIRGWSLWKKYNEGTGILAKRDLFMITSEMKKLKERCELPENELRTYRTVKKGLRITICCFATALLIWIFGAIYSSCNL